MKRLALTFLFVSLAPYACSISNTPAQSSGAGGAPVGGNANSSGGLAASSGGNRTTGGAISSGAVNSTGGVPSSNGGASFSTGGMAAGGANGSYYVNGPWAGYVWTATCTGSSITGDFSTHMTGSPYCVSGSVAPASDYSGWAMLGWNINQTQGSSTPNGTWTPSNINSGGVLISVSNSGGSALRVQIAGPNASTDSSDTWCAAVTGAGGLIPWTSFNTACWDNSGTAYAGQPISNVEVLVPGGNIAAVPFDFCLNSLGVQGTSPTQGTGGAPSAGGATSIGGTRATGGAPSTAGAPSTGGAGGAPPDLGDPLVQRVLNEVVQVATLDHLIYLYRAPNTVLAGSIVRPIGTDPADASADSGAGDGSTYLTDIYAYTVPEDSTLFWIDDSPNVIGASGRNVLVGSKSQDISVLKMPARPAVNGVDVCVAVAGQPVAPADVVAPGTMAVPAAWKTAFPANIAPTGDSSDTTCPDDPPRVYAVLVAGGANKDTDGSVAAAQLHLGQVLTSSGVAVSAVDGVNNPVGAKQRFVDQLANLAKVRCCDQVTVAIVAHGQRYVTRKITKTESVEVVCDGAGKTIPPANCQERQPTQSSEATPKWDQNCSGNCWANCADAYANNTNVEQCLNDEASSYFLWIGDKMLAATDLASGLQQIPSCHISVFIEACHSGGFVDALKGVKGVERVLVSSAFNENSQADTGQPAPIIQGMVNAATASGTSGNLRGTDLQGAWETGEAKSDLVQQPGQAYSSELNHPPAPYIRPDGVCDCCKPGKGPKDDPCGLTCTEFEVLVAECSGGVCSQDLLSKKFTHDQLMGADCSFTSPGDGSAYRWVLDTATCNIQLISETCGGSTTAANTKDMTCAFQDQAWYAPSNSCVSTAGETCRLVAHPYP